ncbi:MAG: HypC/HybG/HupF family hydrogenase formation chaperone [Zoogloeaceae bacterium]|jgi:hydrogenase expression/formation protein HypC|nr:HypC/HybG/HupF family hydrogenase formation chaperone [Zoogloeaceae bacterium]
MCVGIPMRVIEGDAFRARCQGRRGETWIDMRLVGAQPANTWLLTFADTAREVLEAERAKAIDAALDALEMLLSGQHLTPEQLDAFFPDLVGREPEYPASEDGRQRTEDRGLKTERSLRSLCAL